MKRLALLAALPVLLPLSTLASKADTPAERHKVAAAILTPLPPAVLTAQAPATLTAQPSATLYRVDEGLFDLSWGKSIDLTDRRVLLTFDTSTSERNLEQGQIQLKLSGGNKAFHTRGSRIDLKPHGDLSDKDDCYVDLLDFVTPRDGDPVATFRLYCP